MAKSNFTVSTRISPRNFAQLVLALRERGIHTRNRSELIKVAVSTALVALGADEHVFSSEEEAVAWMEREGFYTPGESFRLDEEVKSILSKESMNEVTFGSEEADIRKKYRQFGQDLKEEALRIVTGGPSIVDDDLPSGFTDEEGEDDSAQGGIAGMDFGEVDLPDEPS